MSVNIETGRKGEQLAILYLFSKGYAIRQTNWRFSKAEIDIIAEIDDVVVFVEVKTRKGIAWGKPEEFVNEKKVIMMMDAAYQYLDKNNLDCEIRFDIISILLSSSGLKELNHFEDAFVP